jgi:hypothetical protein
VLARSRALPAAATPAAASHAVASAAPSALSIEERHVAPAPAQVNVEALTGMVIQQLDRRLIAYRERMGRV